MRLEWLVEGWWQFLGVFMPERSTEQRQMRELAAWHRPNYCSCLGWLFNGSELTIANIVAVYERKRRRQTDNYVCIVRCPDCEKRMVLTDTWDYPPEWWMEQNRAKEAWELSMDWHLLPKKLPKQPKHAHSGRRLKRR